MVLDIISRLWGWTIPQLNWSFISSSSLIFIVFPRVIGILAKSSNLLNVMLFGTVCSFCILFWMMTLTTIGFSSFGGVGGVFWGGS